MNVAPREYEFEFTTEDFARIAGLAERVAGIDLPESKMPLVYSRLAKRVRRLGLNRFFEYCELLESDAGANEREQLLSALTTNVTRFFRESQHFDFMTKHVLPSLIAEARKGQRIRLWSAACSTGEEPYSMAMTLLAACPDVAKLDVRILATDIDPNVVEKTKQAVYHESALESVPKPLQRHFTPHDDGHVKVNSEITSLVEVRRLNLIEPWPFSGRFEIVLCRNVVIYFNRALQEKLWQKFHEVLKPGGHLMIGHSERLRGPAEAKMENVGVTTYRKRLG